MSKPIRGVLGSLLLVACSSETAFVSLEPRLVVEPDALDFGPVVAGEEERALAVRVENSGLAELVVDLSLEGADAAAFALDPAPGRLVLAPEEGADLPLTFAPSEVRDHAATLVLASNDPQQVLFPVPLAGLGRVPYAPDVEVVPAGLLDFGEVEVGEEELAFFEIRNLGDADLHLGTLTQAGAGTFALDRDYSGATLPPGDSRPIVLGYTPVQPGGDSGEVRIPSDDPDEPEVVVSVQGNGGGAFEYPEAAIDCPGRVDLVGPVVVALDGSASADPGGEPLTFAWSTVRRPAAADPGAAPEPADQPRTEVRLDAAGTWEVQLQVTNASGVPSVPTKCVIEAVPRDDLHLELSWAGPTSDLDLHLAQEGAWLFDVPGDTSFCNPSPDWGRPGDPADDPRLDLDDDDGLGPENINVAAPAPGVYPVRVHLFDDADDGEVTARVTVFAYGRSVWSGSQVLRRNEVWEVGQVNWPDGTFGVGEERPWDAGGRRSCE